MSSVGKKEAYNLDVAKCQLHFMDQAEKKKKKKRIIIVCRKCVCYASRRFYFRFSAVYVSGLLMYAVSAFLI